MQCSSAPPKSGDGVSDQFPAGLRVLVVDDDPTCLMILEKMLRNCQYEVTKCNRAEKALSLLRGRKNGFDIVISDVHMPDMDGFKLLEYVGLEMDLPVIMMSADDSNSVVMKGVTHGACDYLIKPVRIEPLKNIWQHVFRKRKLKWKDFNQSGSVDDGERLQKQQLDDADISTANRGYLRCSKKRKDEEDEAEEKDDISAMKKPRVVWSVELHQQFVAVVNQLGIDEAVPKKILELMNVPGLSRENVASHLQKYRLCLRRLSRVSQHPSGLNSSFMGHPDRSFGSISSLNALDLQALATTGQLRARSLASIQAAALGRSITKSGISVPFMDQSNLFSFETSQQQPMGNSGKQITLLHGNPTKVEPNQIAYLQQSAQNSKGMNVQFNLQGNQTSSLVGQMAQPHPRPLIIRETNGNHVSRISSFVSQPVLANDVVESVNARRPTYNVVSQASSVVDFSRNQNPDLPGSSFPVWGNSGMSNITSKGTAREEEIYSETKGSRWFAPSYDSFNELHQPNSVGNLRLSTGKDNSGHLNGASTNDRQLNTIVAGGSLKVKTERLADLSDHSTLFHEQYYQEDLMSVLLKQQEGNGSTDNLFGFDGFALDNLPV